MLKKRENKFIVFLIVFEHFLKKDRVERTGKYNKLEYDCIGE